VQVTIPKELIPYVKESVEAAQKAAALPYVGYNAERIAEFTPEQLAVQRSVMGLNAPGKFVKALKQLAKPVKWLWALLKLV